MTEIEAAVAAERAACADLLRTLSLDRFGQGHPCCGVNGKTYYHVCPREAAALIAERT